MKNRKRNIQLKIWVTAEKAILQDTLYKPLGRMKQRRSRLTKSERN